MLAGYYVLVVLSGNGLAELRAHEARDIQALVVLPALYPLAAAGGAAVRGLLDRQAVTQLALAQCRAPRRRRAPSARAWRARCTTRWARRSTGSRSARAGSAHRVEAEAPGAARAARDLSARGAGRRRGGARTDLRPALGHARPAARDALDALRARVVAERNGSRRTCSADGVDLPHPGTRYELFCIVREALENVERHAQRHARSRSRCATWRPTSSCRSPTTASASAASGDARDLQTNGHYGLVGMAERGERIGATVALAGAARAGTRSPCACPAGDVRAPEPWVLEEAAE